MDHNPTHDAPWRTEGRALLSLSVPLVIVNLGWAAIGAVDVLLLGELGAEAVASGALALNLYHAFMIFGIGLTTAASPLIASERGRRLHSVRDIRRTVRQASWAAILLCIPFWLLLWHTEAALLMLGQNPKLAAGAADIMRGVQWALLPYLLHLVLRNYVSALERPMWGVVVTAVAVPFNALVAWLLIFGHFGFPELGLFGAGLAGSITACFMFLGMVIVVLRDRHFRRYHLFGRFWRTDWKRFRTVWAVGLPIAVTLSFEVTVFNAAVFLMGLIDTASLAAHAIAIQIAALCFMVPLGIGQAATVRVGFAHGRRDAAAAGRAGWLALGIGLIYSICSAALLLIFPRELVSAFIDPTEAGNGQVIQLAISFVMIAALFQLVDCGQAIGAGALRGLQDTRVPMLFAAFGYWVIGMGTAILLAFPMGWGGIGIWTGLATGLSVVAILMVWRWVRRDRLALAPHAGPFAAH